MLKRTQLKISTKRKCIECKQPFEAKANNQTVCTKVCEIAHKNKKAKQRVKPELKHFPLKRKKLESNPSETLELQKQINKLARIIDQDCVCISCQKFISGQSEAGHFFGVGAYPELRFNLLNIFVQCHDCNVSQGGNLREYEKGLDKTFGEDVANVILSLPQNYKSLKLSKNQIIETTKLVLEIQKMMSKSNLKMSNSDENRIFLRIEINESIGLYV